MKHTFFQNFPCVPYDENIELLAQKLQNGYSDELDDELNNYIYQKYEITPEEKEYIENLGGFL